MSVRAWFVLKWVGFAVAFPGLLLCEFGLWLSAPGQRMLHFAKDRELALRRCSTCFGRGLVDCEGCGDPTCWGEKPCPACGASVRPDGDVA